MNNQFDENKLVENMLKYIKGEIEEDQLQNLENIPKNEKEKIEKMFLNSPFIKEIDEFYENLVSKFHTWKKIINTIETLDKNSTENNENNEKYINIEVEKDGKIEKLEKKEIKYAAGNYDEENIELNIPLNNNIIEEEGVELSITPSFDEEDIFLIGLENASMELRSQIEVVITFHSNEKLILDGNDIKFGGEWKVKIKSPIKSIKIKMKS